MTIPTAMDAKLVRILTEDGLELHGALFMPSSSAPDLGIAHVHGLAGNFYENRFIYAIAKAAVEKGVAFLTINNRGHDYIADLTKDVDGEMQSIAGGAVREVISDCIPDISAAIGVLVASGVRSVILEGHSTGANKVVYFQSKVQHKMIGGLVLISPCDDIALQHDSTKERAATLLELAKQMVSEGKGEDLMPEGSFYSYPMSARTFYDYFCPGADQDVFPYRTPDIEFKELSSIRVPILATFGGDQDALLIPPGEACALLSSKAINSPGIACKIIGGGSHSYVGHEQELSQNIISWIEETFRLKG